MLKKCVILIVISILISSCSGLKAIGDIGGLVLGSYGIYQNKLLLAKEPLLVTTISKSCPIYKYIQVACNKRVALKMDLDGDALLDAIGENNYLYMTECPDAVRPPPLDCDTP